MHSRFLAGGILKACQWRPNPNCVTNSVVESEHGFKTEMRNN